MCIRPLFFCLIFLLFPFDSTIAGSTALQLRLQHPYIDRLFEACILFVSRIDSCAVVYGTKVENPLTRRHYHPRLDRMEANV